MSMGYMCGDVSIGVLVCMCVRVCVCLCEYEHGGVDLCLWVLGDVWK